MGGLSCLQYEGQSADMVFVAVGKAESPRTLCKRSREVGDIGNNDVDAEHVRLGKHQAAIDNDDIIAILENGHIQTDFAQTSEGNDFEADRVANGCFHGCSGFLPAKGRYPVKEYLPATLLVVLVVDRSWFHNELSTPCREH